MFFKLIKVHLLVSELYKFSKKLLRLQKVNDLWGREQQTTQHNGK
jgi:hypothetical protein